MPHELDPITTDFDAHWNFQDPAGTEAHFLRVLGEADPARGGYLAQLETQIARTHSLRGSFAAAHQWLDRAEARCAAAEAEGRALPVARVRLLLERGRTHNSNRERAQAAPLFAAALSRAQEAGLEALACDAAHMLGIVHPGEQGLVWNLRAIALAEAATQPGARRWLGALYHNTGFSLHDLGRHEEAQVLFEKGLALRLSEDPEGLAARIARWTVGRGLRALGRYEEALSQQRDLAAQLARLGAQDGFVEEELGENLLALGRPEEARPHWARALAQLSQSGDLASLEEARVARLRGLAGA